MEPVKLDDYCDFISTPMDLGYVCDVCHYIRVFLHVCCIIFGGKDET